MFVQTTMEFWHLLKQLRLVNFRAFKDFTLVFQDGAFLVGPNNAGKSTILTALRTADTLIRYAHRRKPDRTVHHEGAAHHGYPISLRDFPALRDSLRYEFGQLEVRLELVWKSGARLVAVWPEEDSDDEQDAFFYLERLEGLAVRSVGDAREAFPLLGIVPILTPLEHSEPSLADAYVKENIAGRLSSRHFRNQLRLLRDQGEWPVFLEWAQPWLGDMAIDTFGHHMGEKALILEVYYREAGSRVPKEVVWAGDGFQIWLQLLYHIFRIRELQTIVLDEPEVYLHPDLQRRLVRLLESTQRQVILATHSSEMLTESDAKLITLVDKRRSRALRPRTEGELEMLSATLGTAFNIRLARALRSRVAVFVEGQDMNVLRRFAKTLKCTAIENEEGITVIPLTGYTHWGKVEPFAWLCKELLPQAIDVCVILDRDYRVDETVDEVQRSLSQAGIIAHIWERKELESYVLTPSVVARLSGASVEHITVQLDAISLDMSTDVFARLLEERLKSEISGQRSLVTVTSEFKMEFDQLWMDPGFRMRVCPPKQMLSQLNGHLQSAGHKPVSSAGLARSHKASEIATELADVLRGIESLVNER